MEDLARAIADRVRGAKRANSKPQLRLVSTRPQEGFGGLDFITRESHCRLIRHLRRRCGLAAQELIDRATFGLSGIEQLPDEALIGLHRDLERALECLRDGISFEDAGLYTNTFREDESCSGP